MRFDFLVTIIHSPVLRIPRIRISLSSPNTLCVARRTAFDEICIFRSVVCTPNACEYQFNKHCAKKPNATAHLHRIDRNTNLCDACLFSVHIEQKACFLCGVRHKTQISLSLYRVIVPFSSPSRLRSSSSLRRCLVVFASMRLCFAVRWSGEIRRT